MLDEIEDIANATGLPNRGHNRDYPKLPSFHRPRLPLLGITKL